MDGVALDGPGADEGHLDGQVVEAPGLHRGRVPHLGPGLHLEHPHGVGPAQQVVDLGLLVEEGHIDLDAVVVRHQVHHVVKSGEHAQPEQIELDQPDGGAVALVPLQDASAPASRAHSTGQTSTTGRSQMTMPPERMPRRPGKS